jgi:hypothetical protein
MRRNRAVVDDTGVLRRGSWCGRVGRQFTRSSPLQRKLAGPHFVNTLMPDRTVLSRLKVCTVPDPSGIRLRVPSRHVEARNHLVQSTTCSRIDRCTWPTTCWWQRSPMPYVRLTCPALPAARRREITPPRGPSPQEIRSRSTVHFTSYDPDELFVGDRAASPDQPDVTARLATGRCHVANKLEWPPASPGAVIAVRRRDGRGQRPFPLLPAERLRRRRHPTEPSSAGSSALCQKAAGLSPWAGWRQAGTDF